jgi:hypothetical protein
MSLDTVDLEKFERSLDEADIDKMERILDLIDPERLEPGLVEVDLSRLGRELAASADRMERMLLVVPDITARSKMGKKTGILCLLGLQQVPQPRLPVGEEDSS